LTTTATPVDWKITDAWCCGLQTPQINLKEFELAFSNSVAASTHFSGRQTFPPPAPKYSGADEPVVASQSGVRVLSAPHHPPPPGLSGLSTGLSSDS
jgi:hypothetical protein